MKSERTYRFRSCTNYGSVTVDGDCIHTTVHHGFSRFTYPTPISKVHPYPIRSWSTPSEIWFLFAFSILIPGFIGFDQLSEQPEMPTLLAFAISIACAGVFAYAWFHRREEWISFPTSIEGHWIRFCRGGRDRKRFDEFTNTLTALIADANSQAEQKPSDAIR